MIYLTWSIASYIPLMLVKKSDPTHLSLHSDNGSITIDVQLIVLWQDCDKVRLVSLTCCVIMADAALRGEGKREEEDQCMHSGSPA